MFDDYNHILRELLIEANLFDDDQLVQLEEFYHNGEGALADQIIEAGLIDKPSLLQLIANSLAYEYVPDLPENLSTELKSSISGSVARNYGILPIDVEGNMITFATQDPFNSSILDDLVFSLKKDVFLVVADPEAVKKLIVNTYGEDESYDDLVEEISESSFNIDADNISDNELSSLANDTPIIKFVNMIIQQAIKDKASDIHLEPFEDIFRIRYRIDGALYEMSPPPRHLALPIISRVKVMADMNVSERRVPQDGRVKLTMAGRPVDLRVSTLPTQFGESVVLRILDKSVVNLDLNQLNMPLDIMEGIRSTVKLPNGIFICTGPTGSGKTTTLYSALREINDPEVKILTAEEPIEYEIEGIMQVGVNHSVGLDFAAALRSFLRQDPDKIMVGEIRDKETAQIAVQASLTGHVVLSTLHTNDAPGAVTRLVDMGLEPFLISASLEAILGQRLLRRIDPNNRVPYEPSQKLIEMLEVDPLEIADKDFFYGAPKPENNNTGYRGRVGIYEMFKMTDHLRELVNDGAPSLVLKQKGIEQGMRTLRDDGIRAIFDGATTIEEVLKYT